ncbi:hypothetical protein SPRG_01545 [Saprolegnia parasitica CBS 223.65]|uniref:PROP1-like PPR domain-containing protein n=1 Tax=Saprolegnia parasitica (strain CBS 223.65) TaxID=695850 RepID=A0A067CUL6_SAPPC|nr:hypothetical protein SPRG_01545 [Saprolegnia parasitica CBS 223.65]KDO34409.1 hypothetical protein SPRG_01545 [Saprolegnia parasitica CBS 223.65]|eukprot:XP_012195143.1 hypothetical protein SPRG_01545 [Saprolegnia parasitica CBS 223.65]
MLMVPTLRRLGRRCLRPRLFSQAAALAVDEPLRSFEMHLDAREPREALRFFEQLPTPPSTQLAQRLAILLAKKASRDETKSALRVMKSVYMNPHLKPDDFTKLAFIYVADACYRNQMLPEALEVTEEAHNLGVRLDLPAYNNLIEALVEADQVEEAELILQDIAAGDVISPEEITYAPIIEALILQREFSQAMELVNQARTNGVQFSEEGYSAMMMITAEVDDQSEALEQFITYLDQCMLEDNVEMFQELDTLTLMDDDADHGDDDDGDSPYGDDDDDDDDDDHHIN